MAAKAPAPKTAAKKAASKVTAKAASTPKGLVLSTAQWKAYNTAYNAAASAARTRIAFQAASNRLRAYRLASAYATMKTAAASRRAAQTAAIAAHATRMSWVQSRLGHQNAALQARIELSMYAHANIAGRLQYIQAGEAAYAHRAIMRTVDESQANAYEARVFSTISKTAKKAASSTINTGTRTTLSKAQSAAIAGAGNAAGTAAARNPAKVRAAPRVSPGARRPKSRSPWIGNEEEPRCIAFAVANHLLHAQWSGGLRLYGQDIDELDEAGGPEPVIEEVLWRVWLSGWPSARPVRLRDYRKVEDGRLRSALSLIPLVIGYKTEYGDHAALSLPSGRVVTWGSVAKLKPGTEIEEAWELTWES
jgi:hypothetical protein